MFKELLVVVIVAYLSCGSEAYLQVKGKEFYYNGQKVFLSGANVAWNEIGKDWGNGQYWKHRSKMNEWLSGINTHGGNVARVWLHCGGDISPQFDSQGYVVGTDHENYAAKKLNA